MRNQDRLSFLPDNLLSIIISLLPFKEAVRTSILSRRWQSIPIGTRNMEFNERDFVQPPLDSEEVRQNKRRAFVDLVTRWIGNYQDSDSDKFRLEFSHPEEHLLQMERCINFAIARKVKVLDLDFSDPTWSEDNFENHHTSLQVPSNDDEHRSTLEVLRLFSCNIPTISRTSQNFSALKEVCLGWVTLTSASIKNFMEKCPVLEILSLKKCCYDGYIEVIGPSLKTLVLEKCFAHDRDMMTVNFLINAPNLRLFKYSGVLCSLEFERLRSMEEAELDFGLQREYGEFGDTLYRVLVEIGCVKTLTLCSYMLQVIPCGEEPFKLKPALGRVKRLILHTSLDRNEFYGISFFLNSCPNLEVLTIDLTTTPRNFPEYDPPLAIEQHAFLITSPYQLAYSCVRKKLKSVVVRGFKGEPNELVVLRYLLKFGRYLDSLHIKISKERASDGTSMEETYVEKVKSLQKFQIASKGLRIFLYRRA